MRERDRSIKERDRSVERFQKLCDPVLAIVQSRANRNIRMQLSHDPLNL